MKKRMMFVLAVVLCSSLLAGCSNTTSLKEKEATINLSSEPPEMLSFLSTDSTSGNVLRHVMEGLIVLDENNNAQVGVAKSVPTKGNGGISEDGKTITFTLNENAKWSNGETVTAQDFEFAWDNMFTLSSGAQYASTWAPLIEGASELLSAESKDEINKAMGNKGWTASDDGKIFTVQLTGPYSYFVNLMAFYNFLPLQKEAYEEFGGIDKYGNDVKEFLGNGPFVISEWNHESDIVLEKNINYWNKDEVKLDKITMKMIKETSTANNEFDNGTIDMIGLTGEDIANYKKQEFNVLDYADGSVWYLQFNTQMKGLNNEKVRRAITYAFDVPTYIDTLVKNGSSPATAFTAPSVKNGTFVKEIGDIYGRTYDKKQFKEAKALLDEGLKEEGLSAETFEITILGDTGDSPQKTYAYFQNQIQKNLGIKVNVQQVEFQDRLNKTTNKDFDVVYSGWSADYDDAMSYLDLWVSDGGNNHTSWYNEKYDQIINSALVENDETKRDALLKQAEEILAKECPIGVIYYRYRSYVTSDRLQGVVRNAFSDIDLTKAYIQ